MKLITKINSTKTLRMLLAQQLLTHSSVGRILNSEKPLNTQLDAISKRHVQSSSPTILTESPFANQGGFLKKKLYKYLGLGDSNVFALRRATIFHYQACTDKLDFGVFFQHLKLPDTMFSFFLVAQWHLWMCQARSMLEGPEGRTLRNEILERMWVDIDNRLNELDFYTVGARKGILKDLLYHHQGAMFSYDEGLMGDDKILAGALWRTLFSKDKNIDPEILEITVKYTRIQMHNLRAIGTREWCLNGRFDWAPFSPFTTKPSLLNTSASK